MNVMMLRNVRLSGTLGTPRQPSDRPLSRLWPCLARIVSLSLRSPLRWGITTGSKKCHGAMVWCHGNGASYRVLGTPGILPVTLSRPPPGCIVPVASGAGREPRGDPLSTRDRSGRQPTSFPRSSGFRSGARAPRRPLEHEGPKWASADFLSSQLGLPERGESPAQTP